MKVLLVHNAYQQQGGEDSVFNTEHNLLVGAGVEVHTMVRSNEEIQSNLDKVKVFFQARNNRQAAADIRDTCLRIRPDVVHIHNFFPLFSPSIHKAARDTGAAVVQTLHNYRLLCANALFLRDGAVCESCVDSGRWNAVRHGCYRGSRVASASVVAMQQRAFQADGLQQHVDRFIALTQFSAQKFSSSGLGMSKIMVKPNFVYSTAQYEDSDREYYLYVGRLSTEKGLHDLVAAWNSLPDQTLKIVGDGPERKKLQELASPKVEFLGRKNPTEVSQLMSGAKALLIPSIWYEGFPMTAVEALSNGCPLLVSTIGSLEEIVRDEIGERFIPGNAESIVAAVKRFEERDIPLISRRARAEYDNKYTPENNLKLLMQVYQEAIAARQVHLT